MSKDNDQQLFDETFLLFKAEVANLGFHLRWDAGVRDAYNKQISGLSEKIKKQVYSKGRPITWEQAAKKAREARNGNPPEKKRFSEVEFSRLGVLQHEEIKVHRQPDH